MSAGFDPARRNLLRARRPDAPPAPRPPWLDAARLAEACTRCGDCLRACPEGVLIAGDGGFPEIDFARGGCSFCGACAVACRPGLFDRTKSPWDLVAAIGDACLARAGVHCQSCGDACAARAIRFALALGRPPQPGVAAESCTGCGACVAVCPGRAISMGARGA